MYNVAYLTDQLQWMQDTLYAAEQANEIVHILAHVPSNDLLCYKPWAKEYRKIIERFVYRMFKKSIKPIPFAFQIRQDHQSSIQRSLSC
jgi:hypothetical protein